MGADLATRINRDIQTTSRALGIPPGVFVADVVYSERPLPTGPPPPMTAEMRDRNRATMLRQSWEVIGIEPDVEISRTEAFDAARKLAESRAATPMIHGRIACSVRAPRF